MRIKKYLAAFVILVYLMQISLLVGLGIFFALPDGRIYFAFIAPATFLVPAFILGCINTARGFCQIFEPCDNVYKTVMIAKLSLIPFFLLNFALCFCLIAGLLNPFLFMSIFIVIPVFVGITYAIMFVSSSYNIGYIINRIKNADEGRQELIVYLVLQFFFVFDVVSGVLLFIRDKQNNRI